MKWRPDDKGCVWDEAGRPVCVVGDPDEPLGKKDRANLALIVVAPDLVRELEETATWLEERAAVLNGIIATHTKQGKGLAVEVSRIAGRVVVLRQAILKAKGG